MKKFAVIALTQGGATMARHLIDQLKKQEYKVELILPERLAQRDEEFYSR